LLDGINVKDIKLSSLRKNIGVVQQDVYLFAGTVLENIRYGKPDASQAEILEAAKNANTHDFIIALQMDTIPTLVSAVFGYQAAKQRLSIARVFLKNPPVLISMKPPVPWTMKARESSRSRWRS
jgi:ATP-binding cassette subfamily B protein